MPDRLGRTSGRQSERLRRRARPADAAQAAAARGAAVTTAVAGKSASRMRCLTWRRGRGPPRRAPATSARTTYDALNTPPWMPGTARFFSSMRAPPRWHCCCCSFSADHPDEKAAPPDTNVQVAARSCRVCLNPVGIDRSKATSARSWKRSVRARSAVSSEEALLPPLGRGIANVASDRAVSCRRRNDNIRRFYCRS